MTVRHGNAGGRAVRVITQALRRQGFCIVPGLISARRCAQLRAAMRCMLEGEREQNLRPTGHQRVLHLAAKDRRFLDLVQHPLVLAVWRSYLGEDMLCSSLTGNALWPGSTEQYWHVDHPYWTMAEPYPVSLPLAGQTIWMLDDFTRENGATAGLAGSHQRGRLPRLDSRWPKGATPITGRCGSAILMDGALWHTSTPNRSPAVRSAVLVKYIRSFCVTQEDMRHQLAAVQRPTRTLARLFGAEQYVPTRKFPY